MREVIYIDIEGERQIDAGFWGFEFYDWEPLDPVDSVPFVQADIAVTPEAVEIVTRSCLILELLDG